jgi:hypothetical protein
MTDAPKVPDGAADAAAGAVDDIVEVIFEDHYTLAIVAFIAGALIVAGIVYMIGTRMVQQEGDTDAAD